MNPNPELNVTEPKQTPEETTPYAQKTFEAAARIIEQPTELVEIFEAYQSFAPLVKQLAEQITENDDSHIGSGSNSYVYLVEKDSQQYAVRLAKGKNTEQIAMHTAAAPLAASLSHVEHIVAASYEDGATVAEVVPGKQMGTLSIQEAQTITPDHISEFAYTLKSLHENGISIDPSKPSNFLYDSIEGFGVVDITTADRNPQTLSEVLSWGASILTCTASWFDTKTESDFNRALSYATSSANNLKIYRDVITRIDMSSGQRIVVLGKVNNLINTTDTQVAEYSDVGWVAQAVEEAHRPAREISDEEMNSEV